MQDHTAIVITAMLVLMVIEIAALSMGIDGQLMMIVVVLISSIAGCPLGLKILQGDIEKKVRASQRTENK